MQIKTNLRLTLSLTFDEDDGDWTIDTRLTSGDGFDEIGSISPMHCRFPSIKDCKEEIDELFKVFAESLRQDGKGKKR